jgi:hypothetical protein
MIEKIIYIILISSSLFSDKKYIIFCDDFGRILEPLSKKSELIALEIENKPTIEYYYLDSLRINKSSYKKAKLFSNISSDRGKYSLVKGENDFITGIYYLDIAVPIFIDGELVEVNKSEKLKNIDMQNVKFIKKKKIFDKWYLVIDTDLSNY